MGLISHRSVVGELEGRLADVVQALLAKPADALRQTQRLLRQGRREEVLERMRLESALFAERLQSAEAKDAISASSQAAASAASAVQVVDALCEGKQAADESAIVLRPRMYLTLKFIDPVTLLPQVR